MLKSMQAFLVALAFVVMGLSINPNSAWAKSTPLDPASAGSTSMDPRPAYNRKVILALQGRVDIAEKEIARLESLRVSFKVACADVADAACQADVQRLTRQIKALKAEIARIDADRAADRVRIDGEIARIDAARASDRKWVEGQIASINTALATAKTERQELRRRLDQLEGRVQRLEDEPKAGLLVGVSGSVFGHDAVSDLGVTRVGGAGGLTAGAIIETPTAGLVIDGAIDWTKSGLGGTHWRTSAVGFGRRSGGMTVGAGLTGQLTLLGQEGNTFYQSWGLGPEVRVSKQLTRVAEGRKLFPTLSLRLGVPMGPVFVEGERLAQFRPGLELGATVALKLGGRGPRR